MCAVCRRVGKKEARRLQVWVSRGLTCPAPGRATNTVNPHNPRIHRTTYLSAVQTGLAQRLSITRWRQGCLSCTERRSVIDKPCHCRRRETAAAHRIQATPADIEEIAQTSLLYCPSAQHRLYTDVTRPRSVRGGYDASLSRIVTVTLTVPRKPRAYQAAAVRVAVTRNAASGKPAAQRW